MKKIIVIATFALISQFALAQKTDVAPPPPPPPPPPVAAPAPPPPPPAPDAPEKPMKVRTKNVEVIVSDKGTVTTDGTEDVNVNAGRKKIIVRKIKKMDGDTSQPEIQLGDRKIIIKEGDDVRVEGDKKIEKVIVKKRKSDDGKTETITIDTDAVEAEVESAMAELEKQMDALEKQMDGKEKDMNAAEKELEKAKTPAETEAANKKMATIGDEMGKIGEKMGKIGEEMGKIGEEMGDLGDLGGLGESHGKHHDKPKSGNAKVKNRFIMFDFGVNGLMQNGSFNLTGEAEPMEIFYGKSFFYRIGAFQQRIPMDKKGHANFTWGADFEFDNIELSRPITIQNTQPFTLVTENKTFNQNRLYSSWVDVPIGFHFQTNRKSSKGFRLGVGGFGGLMLAALQDQDAKDDKSQKLEIGSNLNKIRYGAQVTIGSGPINLVARYNVSPLFLSGKGPGLNAFNVGISVIPF